ncbi:MAG: HmuY family protein, partial [Muribaculaceae bacterium]|nr:HmuY family protein [Muribaculaceae bacterium]
MYDKPIENENITTQGKLYIDATNWEQWHYIDFDSITERADKNPQYNPSSAWITMPVPVTPIVHADDGAGIYTYWYDVYGAGISDYEFRSYQPTSPQSEPESWTIAIHRNNIRTNGCSAAATDFTNINNLPTEKEFYQSLTYQPDDWNETDVWTIQDKMLLGLI